MSAQSVLLLLKLVSEGVGVASEISELARRIRAGEEVTEAEIELARKQVAESVANWDKAAKDKTDWLLSDNCRMNILYRLRHFR